jgi:hypothetical protein
LPASPPAPAPAPAPAPTSTPTGEAVHYGVGCDGCNMAPIVGERHQLDGEDFDLCHSCFIKLLPMEHARYTTVQPAETFSYKAAAADATLPAAGWLPWASLRKPDGPQAEKRGRLHGLHSFLEAFGNQGARRSVRKRPPTRTHTQTHIDKQTSHNQLSKSTH